MNNSASFAVPTLALRVLMGVLVLGQSANVLAQERTTGAAGIATPGTTSIPVGPFEFVPNPRWTPPEQEKAGPQREGESKRLADLYAKGQYRTVGNDGLALLSKEKFDDQLRFYIANSLAWTSRLKEADKIYETLKGTAYAKDALIGQANLNRWQQKMHAAEPLYREVLKTDPKNKDALEGLELAGRVTRPKTTATVGALNDSSNVQMRYWTLNHTWRDPSRKNVMELETSRIQAQNPTLRAWQSDLTFRYRMLDTPFKPKFEASADGTKIYGNVGIELDALPITIDVGRVNWGRLSNNPSALTNHLSANRLGVQAVGSFNYGQVVARADVFKVSDGNSLTTSSLRWNPTWRPLGANIKPIVGIDTRSSSFTTASYWSPAQGYGSLYAGFSGEWTGQDWNLYATAAPGVRLFGEAGNSWSLSAGGKRWLNRDWALGMNLWAMRSRRDNAEYKAQSLNFTLERLWE
jgi:hypothetical protein